MYRVYCITQLITIIDYFGDDCNALLVITVTLVLGLGPKAKFVALALRLSGLCLGLVQHDLGVGQAWRRL